MDQVTVLLGFAIDLVLVVPCKISILLICACMLRKVDTRWVSGLIACLLFRAATIVDCNRLQYQYGIAID